MLAFCYLPSCSLDGHPLQIKQLRGEEPVESIDLSGKGLTTLSAIVIAGLIPLNTATKSLKCAAPLKALYVAAPTNWLISS